MFRVPVGGSAELECATQDQGDWMKVWKNGTRVISVGSLQVEKNRNLTNTRTDLFHLFLEVPHYKS